MLSLTSVATLIDDIWLDVMKPPRARHRRSRKNYKRKMRNSVEQQRFVESRRRSKAKGLLRRRKNYSDNDNRKKYKSFKDKGFRRRVNARKGKVITEVETDTDSDCTVDNAPPVRRARLRRPAPSNDRLEEMVVDLVQSDNSVKQPDIVSKSSTTAEKSVCKGVVSKNAVHPAPAPTRPAAVAVCDTATSVNNSNIDTVNNKPTRNCEPILPVAVENTSSETVKIKLEPTEEVPVVPVVAESNNNAVVMNDERSTNACPPVVNNSSPVQSNVLMPAVPISVAVKQELIEQNDSSVDRLMFGSRPQLLAVKNRPMPLFCTNTSRSPMLPRSVISTSPISFNEQELTEKINSVLLIGDEGAANTSCVMGSNKLDCFIRDRVVNIPKFVVPRVSRSVVAPNVSPGPSMSLKYQSALYSNATNLFVRNTPSCSSNPTAVSMEEARGNQLNMGKNPVASLSSPVNSFNNLKRSSSSNNQLFVALNVSTPSSSSAGISGHNIFSPNFAYHNGFESRKLVGNDVPGCSNSLNTMKTPTVFDASSHNTMLRKPADLLNLMIVDKSGLPPENCNAGVVGQINDCNSSINIPKPNNHTYIEDAGKSNNGVVASLQCIPTHAACLDMPQQVLSKNMAGNGNVFVNVSAQPKASLLNSNLSQFLSSIKSTVAYSVPTQSALCNTLSYGHQQPTSSGIQISSQVQESIESFLKANQHVIAANDSLAAVSKVSVDSLMDSVRNVSTHDDMHSPAFPDVRAQCSSNVLPDVQSDRRGHCRTAAGTFASFLCVCDDHHRHSPERTCAMTPSDDCCAQQSEPVKVNESALRSCPSPPTLQTNEEVMKDKSCNKELARLDSYMPCGRSNVICNAESAIAPSVLSTYQDNCHTPPAAIRSESELQQEPVTVDKFILNEKDRYEESDTHSSCPIESSPKSPPVNESHQSTRVSVSSPKSPPPSTVAVPENLTTGERAEKCTRKNDSDSGASVCANSSSKRKSPSLHSMMNSIKRARHAERHDDVKASKDESAYMSDRKLVINEDSSDEDSKDSHGEESSIRTRSMVHEGGTSSGSKDGRPHTPEERPRDYTILKSLDLKKKTWHSSSEKDGNGKHHYVSQVENEKRVPSIKIKIIQSHVQRGESSDNNETSSSNRESMFICESSKVRRVKSKKRHKDREHHSRHRTRTTSREDSEADQELQPLPTIPKSACLKISRDTEHDDDDDDDEDKEPEKDKEKEGPQESSENGKDSDFLVHPTRSPKETTSRSLEPSGSESQPPGDVGYKESSRLHRTSQYGSEDKRDSVAGNVDSDVYASHASDSSLELPRREMRLCKIREIPPDCDCTCKEAGSLTSLVMCRGCRDRDDSDDSVKSSDIVIIKKFKMTRADADKLHVSTCEMDHTLCMSQFKFREFFSKGYEVSPSVPVPFPSYIEDSIDPKEGKTPTRCPCIVCSENLCVLIANYKKLTQYRNSRFSNDEFRKFMKLFRHFGKPRKRAIEELLRTDVGRSPNNTPEPDCSSLPLKKRKTFTHLPIESGDNSNSNHPQEQDERSTESSSTRENPSSLAAVLPALPEKPSSSVDESVDDGYRNEWHYRSSRFRHSSLRRSCNEDTFSYDVGEGNHSNSSNSSDVYNDPGFKQVQGLRPLITLDSHERYFHEHMARSLRANLGTVSTERLNTSANDTDMAVETLLNFAYNLKRHAAEYNSNPIPCTSTALQPMNHSSDAANPEHERQMISSSDNNDATSSRNFFERDPRITRNRSRDNT